MRCLDCNNCVTVDVRPAATGAVVVRLQAPRRVYRQYCDSEDAVVRAGVDPVLLAHKRIAIPTVTAMHACGGDFYDALNPEQMELL